MQKSVNDRSGESIYQGGGGRKKKRKKSVSCLYYVRDFREMEALFLLLERPRVPPVPKKKDTLIKTVTQATQLHVL